MKTLSMMTIIIAFSLIDKQLIDCTLNKDPENVACYDIEDLLSSDNNFIKLIDVGDGSVIKLACSFCSGKNSYSPRLWYFKRETYNESSKIEKELYNDKTRIMIDSENSLILNNFNNSIDSGIYSCKSNLNDDVTFTYQLDGVFNVNVKPYSGTFHHWHEYKRLILDPLNEQFENPSKEPFVTFQNTAEFSFRVKTYWEDWGPCQDHLDSLVGHRIKKGKCRLQVVPINNLVKNKEKSNMDQYFDISCRSQIFNDKWPQISRIVRNIPDYETTENCTLDHVLNKKDLKDEKFKSAVTKQVPENSNCVLSCLEGPPENKVEWYKNTTLLNVPNRKIMGNNDEDQHLAVDSFNSLYIFNTTKNDESEYYCIVNGKNSVRYMVKVVPKCGLINDDFVRYSIYLGFVMLLTTTCYCAGICVAWHERGSFADPLNLNIKKGKACR